MGTIYSSSLAIGKEGMCFRHRVYVDKSYEFSTCFDSSVAYSFTRKPLIGVMLSSFLT